MSTFPLGPVPYQIRMPHDGKIFNGASDHAYQFSKENNFLHGGPRKIMFPSTRAVLWDRTPTGTIIELAVPGKSSAVRFFINKRTLLIAHKQLMVHGKDFEGFCIGELQTQGEQVSILIDRFDPGKDGQIKTEFGVQNIRIPTISIAGDVHVPIMLHTGMAFVDHETTQTHTEEEFFKTMMVLESWCSRKDAMKVSDLFSLKLKCCFQENENEILTYLTCSMVFIKEQINLLPVNPIPIIPTALARNLEGPVSFSAVQSQVKTGYITMDQTRKLLLLLETDPKAYSLPLVGVWMSGIETVQSAEVWSCCIRFIHNRNIEERVYAPPASYLLVAYPDGSALPVFYEFSQDETKTDGVQFDLVSCCDGIAMDKETKTDGVQFDLVSCCDGIAMDKTADTPHNEEEYVFELDRLQGGTMKNTFSNAIRKMRNRRKSVTTSNVEEPSSKSLDDSIPNQHLPLSPHPQILSPMNQSFPSVPDLSICDSLSGEPDTLSRSIVETNVGVNNGYDDIKESKKDEAPIQRSVHANKKSTNKKLPRQTKASLARMNVNKQVKNKSPSPNKKSAKKANLAITFSNAKKKEREVEKAVNESLLSNPVGENEIDIDFERIGFNSKIEFDEPILKLPVTIRPRSGNNEPANSSYSIGTYKSDPDGGRQAYCPTDYSDLSAEESFIIGSNQRDENVDDIPAVNDNRNVTKVTDIDSNMAKYIEKFEYREKRMDENQFIRNSSNSTPKSMETESEKSAFDQMSEKIEDDRQGENDYLDDQEEKRKNDLYDLVLAQQEQLSNLQAQLQVFLKHQNIKPAVVKQDEVVEEKEKKATALPFSKEVCTIQEKQQQQLNELQQQVKEFLYHSDSKVADKRDSSSQCNTELPLPPRYNSVAVNTGASLLWPTVNMASTNSDTTPRGLIQAEGIASKEGKRESFCHHCHRAKRGAKRYRKSESNTMSTASSDDTGMNSPSLSDIKPEDIDTSIFEDTASTSQSITSSLREVDMPVYDDGQDKCLSPQVQRKSKMDWDSSPLLGESASMLGGYQEKKGTILEDEKLVKEDELDENPVTVDDKEFYSQLMTQVQKLIEAQNISPPSENLEENSRLLSDLQPAGNLDNLQTSKEEDVVLLEDDIEHLRNVTVKQLNELIQNSSSCESSTSDLLAERGRCHSTAITPLLPRINYMSMGVDETFMEESNFNKIAAKYLPHEYIQNEMMQVRNKTVKFEGVYEFNTLATGKCANMSSVNFSCNMSIASKKYLQRYELMDDEKSTLVPLRESNINITQVDTSQLSMDSRSYSDSDKENILDFKKLRNLPKLL